MSDTAESARPAWVDDRLFPFDSRFIEIDGNTVHYLDEGHGPTLLFLHGNPTWSFLWREVVTAFVDALDLERTTLVGQDWGGLILGGPAARFLVRRLNLLVTAFIPTGRVRRTRGIRRGAARLVGEARRLGPAGQLTGAGSSPAAMNPST
ncbi:hypothetical protein [Nocardia asteroides]|uniref:hypothetical protein n=1 Tax=Nocardia asteroides TaxID=1824 RepID=UPI0033F23998